MVCNSDDLLPIFRDILSEVRGCGLEGLKFQSKQTAQRSFVQTGRFRQTVLKSPLEQLKVFIIGRREAFFSDEFPQAFNQIEIGGVGRQEEDFDQEGSSPLQHEPTVVIAGIIHHQGHRGGEAEGGDLFEQFAHTGGVDVAVVGHRDELMGDGMQGSQHVESLPSTGSTHDDASETP